MTVLVLSACLLVSLMILAFFRFLLWLDRNAVQKEIDRQVELSRCFEYRWWA